MSRVVIAGAGALGQQLATRLAERHDVRCVRSSPDLPAPNGRVTWHQADLCATPHAEVALAGAETVVLLAQSRNAPARLPRASAENLDLLVADSVGRAARRCGAKHLVHFASGDDDARVALLEQAGVPLTVLRGGGPEPLRALEALVDGGPGTNPNASERWTGANAEPRDPRIPTCSVQRYVRPKGWTAFDLTRAYFEWLPLDVPLLKTSFAQGVFTLSFPGIRALMLRVEPGRSDADCTWLDIAGGVLNGQPEHEARMEFRVLLDGTTAMATLFAFQPSLPWPVYRVSQALMHERVMRRFGEWLETQQGQPPPRAP